MDLIDCFCVFLPNKLIKPTLRCSDLSETLGNVDSLAPHLPLLTPPFPPPPPNGCKTGSLQNPAIKIDAKP